MTLQTQMRTVLEQLTQAAEKLESAAAQIARERSEKSALQEKNAILESENDALKRRCSETSADAAETERLRREIEDLTNTHNRLIADKNQLLGEREQMKMVRAGWENERAELIDAREKAEAELRRLSEAPASGDEESDFLKSENEALRRQCADLKNEKRQAEEFAENVAVERDGIKAAYDELKRIAAEASERLDATLEELKILKGEGDNGDE